MESQQLLVRLPEDLLGRFRRGVPARQRSAFVQLLLEKALPPEEDDPLYRVALAVEGDEQLAAEMADWDGVAGDGFEQDAAPLK